jgi:hypothetical protein
MLGTAPGCNRRLIVINRGEITLRERPTRCVLASACHSARTSVTSNDRVSRRIMPGRPWPRLRVIDHSGTRACVLRMAQISCAIFRGRGIAFFSRWHAKSLGRTQPARRRSAERRSVRERRWIRASNALGWSCGLGANGLFRTWTFPRHLPNFRDAPAPRTGALRSTLPPTGSMRVVRPPGRAPGGPRPGPARGLRRRGHAPGLPPPGRGRTVPPPGHEQAGRPPGPARGPRRPGPAPSNPPPGRELAASGPANSGPACARRKSRTSRRRSLLAKCRDGVTRLPRRPTRIARPPMFDAFVPRPWS